MSAKPFQPWPEDIALDGARRMMRAGASLKECAEKVGWSAADLDKALWQALGRRK